MAYKTKWDETKYIYVNFRKKKIEHLSILVDNQIIPHEYSVKYLGMTLDAKLGWKEQVKKKREELRLE